MADELPDTGGQADPGKAGAMSDATITLWRPVGPAELRLIEQAEMKAFPPRLPEQPIFYPVTTEKCAAASS
jgi:hypothetical protein